ncbi:MAG: nuclear transport factor 2 family protein [Sphingomonadales bacterium]
MNIKQKVREYYSRIDGGDLAWVIALFDKECEYYRADTSYIGLAAIQEFYEKGRKIKGKHSLESVFSDGTKVAVNGVFEGFGGDGSPRKISFADFWIFNGLGRVIQRKTYLAIGSDYVKD